MTDVKYVSYNGKSIGQGHRSTPSIRIFKFTVTHTKASANETRERKESILT
jgi:hypothetical protein